MAIPSEKEPILLRPASFLQDPSRMAVAGYDAYSHDPLINFLSPGRIEHRTTCLRNTRHRVTNRMFSPRNVTLVAHPASDPRNVVGYIQFARLGDNFSPIQNSGWPWSWIARLVVMYWAALAWMHRWYGKAVNYVSPDLSEDLEHRRLFEAWNEIDEARYWDPVAFPARKERWAVQSMVVSPDWQRRGIGRQCMVEVIKRAKKDGVCIEIEASSVGALLYSSVGFEKLGDFAGDEIGDGSGGVMIWRPEGFEDKTTGGKESK